MKNHFFIIMLLLGGGFACAQTTTVSKESEIPLVVGEKTIVRSCDNDVIVTYVKNNNTNTFDVRHRSSFMHRYFSLNYELNPSGGALYTINDMYIHKRWCYFCGTKCNPTGTLLSLNGLIVTFYDTVGFVGRFNIDSVLNGTGYYYLRQVNEAKTLDRLTVYDSWYLTIDAIGSYKGGSDSTCVAELFYSNLSGSWRWEYGVFVPDDPQEILTDIIMTEKSLVTSSRWNNDRENLLIRQMTVGGIRAVTIPVYRYIYYSPMVHRLPYHRYELCPMNCDTFQVAYEAMGLNTNPTICLYMMGDPSAMLQRQYLRTQDLNQLIDMTYVHRNDGIVLLCQDGQYPNGVLRFPKWFPMQHPYEDTLLYSNTVSLQSIDADDNLHFLVVGENHTSHCLHHYIQHGEFVSSAGNICMNRDICSDCYEFLNPLEPSVHRREWINKNSDVFTWTKNTCNTKNTSVKPICNIED